MTPPPRASRARAVFSAVVVLAIVAGVAGFARFAAPEPVERTEGPGVEPLLVETLSVEWRGSFTVTRSFVGRVEARQRTDLGFEIPGTIDAVLVDEGDTVRAGDPIARLNTDRLEATRAERRAARDRTAAEAELAELRFERTADAFASSASSRQAYDDAEKQRDAARAALAAANAAIASLDTEIAKAVIRAPYDAVVAARSADAGRVIAAGEPVVRLLDRESPEVRFSLSGNAATAVAVGDALAVRIADETVPGTLAAILPTRDAATRGVDAIVRLDATLDGIRVGDLARLDLPRERIARGFWVPFGALTEGPRGLWSVDLLEPVATDADAPDAAGPARFRIVPADVAVLHEQTDRVFVTGALREGDRLVASGLHRVTPGMVVRTSDTRPVERDGSHR